MPLPHPLPQGLPHHCWTPNCGWLPLGVGTPPLPSHPSAVPVPKVQPLLLQPLPSHSLRTCAAGGGLSGQRIRPGISTGSWGSKGAGETWPHSLLIFCPPNGSPISSFGLGIPSPQGRQSHLTSTSPPPSLCPRPTSYPVAAGSSRPLSSSWSPTSPL